MVSPLIQETGLSAAAPATGPAADRPDFLAEVASVIPNFHNDLAPLFNNTAPGGLASFLAFEYYLTG